MSKQKANTENKEKAFWEKLSLVEREYIKSDIKALNQRMTDLEKHGMVNTSAYNNLKSWALTLPHNIVKREINGKMENVVRAKQSVRNITPENVVRTNAIKANPLASRGGEVKQIKDWYKENEKPEPTTQEAERVADRMGELHDFINDHKDAYYGIDALGNSNTLHSAVKRSDKLTFDEAEQFFKLMANVDEAVRRNKEAYDRLLDTPQVSQ